MAVVGDSTVKNIFGPAYFNNKNRVFVKSFSGEKSKCRKSYIISTAELQPEVIILHCGTNDLRQTVTPEVIALKIVVLETSVKAEKNVITISGIIARKDPYKDKVKDAIECLKKLCNCRNISCVDHSYVTLELI